MVPVVVALLASSLFLLLCGYPRAAFLACTMALGLLGLDVWCEAESPPHGGDADPKAKIVTSSA